MCSQSQFCSWKVSSYIIRETRSACRYTSPIAIYPVTFLLFPAKTTEGAIVF